MDGKDLFDGGGDGNIKVGEDCFCGFVACGGFGGGRFGAGFVSSGTRCTYV